MDTVFSCRPGCAACCTAPSITSPIPGMPQGKPAGVPCVQLDDGLRCRLFGTPERPSFCGTLKPGPDMCGTSRQDAMALLSALERATATITLSFP
ncbi:YkgJ family cysteine cluster protein [Pseudoxanthomonas mexicana]|uniref:YkgJ family cysteine cluster protein n=1 Tax=Pseudoxanthomonas mexicana TaxID=128785 RepID=UPI0009FB7FB1|nr:YkgJ family cysteine cluster protein [Pseudoxanthomonas mexicana]